MKNNYKLTCLVILLLMAVGFLGCDHSRSSSATTNSSAVLVYSTSQISEDSSNDGSFSATITITLDGTTFNENLVDGVDFDTIGLPDGLTATLTQISDTEAKLDITGVAVEHSFCSDTDMTFFFNESAFTDNRLPVSFELPISISWFTPILTFSATTLSENSTSDDGSFTQTFTITASNGGEFRHNGGPTVHDELLTRGLDFTWSLPTGLNPVLNPSVANPDTVIDVSFIGTAVTSSPASDTTSELQFIIGKGVVSDYCPAFVTKNIAFEFVRTLMMYTTQILSNGNLSGMTGADQLCFFNKPKLPDDYTHTKSFASFDGAHEIRDLHNTAAVPDTIHVESITGARIKDSLQNLLSDGFIDQSLSDADVTSTAYFTGSLANGALSTNCNGFTSSSASVFSSVGDSGSADANWINDTVGGDQMCSTTGNVMLCLTYP